jgi:dihydroorotate dehydrogenase (NAD+) catalytic subunit
LRSQEVEKLRVKSRESRVDKPLGPRLSTLDSRLSTAQSEIPRGVYPEQTAEILRYAQDDSEWARNDRLPAGDRQTSPKEQFIPRIETEIAGIRFQNPVWTASGTFGYGKEFSTLVDLNELGAIVVKGISPKPMEGNPSPRIYETDSGMLNAIGLQNVGARRFLDEKLPFLRTLKARCIVNVFAYSTEDYVRCIEILNPGEGIAAYELNISCPNTRCGGMVYGSDPKLTEEVVAACKKAARYPLFVKLSPNVTDITVFGRAAEAAGADALSLVNTFVGMAIDVETRTPRLWNVTGGLSGPSIKPVAVRMVYQTARAVKIPVIGLGGISATEDALEFFIAGASAVQVGTANFYDPRTSIRIVRGLRDYCRKKRLHLSEIIGSLKIPGRATPKGPEN